MFCKAKSLTFALDKFFICDCRCALSFRLLRLVASCANLFCFLARRKGTTRTSCFPRCIRTQRLPIFVPGLVGLHPCRHTIRQATHSCLSGACLLPRKESLDHRVTFPYLEYIAFLKCAAKIHQIADSTQKTSRFFVSPALRIPKFSCLALHQAMKCQVNMPKERCHADAFNVIKQANLGARAMHRRRHFVFFPVI